MKFFKFQVKFIVDNLIWFCKSEILTQFFYLYKTEISIVKLANQIFFNSSRYIAEETLFLYWLWSIFDHLFFNILLDFRSSLISRLSFIHEPLFRLFCYLKTPLDFFLQLNFWFHVLWDISSNLVFSHKWLYLMIFFQIIELIIFFIYSNN